MIKVSVTIKKECKDGIGKSITISAENDAPGYVTDTMKLVVNCVENACAAMGLEVNE